MMKDVTMELAQILMVKVCHQGVVIFSKIPPLTLEASNLPVCLSLLFASHFCHELILLHFLLFLLISILDVCGFGIVVSEAQL